MSPVTSLRQSVSIGVAGGETESDQTESWCASRGRREEGERWVPRPYQLKPVYKPRKEGVCTGLVRSGRRNVRFCR
jgi:hypothetical protein